MKKPIDLFAPIVFSVLSVLNASCGAKEPESQSPQSKVEASADDDGSHNRQEEELARAQKEMEAAIELMRAQGVPEEQIEQFRRTTQGVRDNAETDAEKEQRRASRKAKSDSEAFQSQYGDAPEISVRLAGESYKLKRTVCQSDPDNYRVSGFAGEEKDAARFSYSRSKLPDGSYISTLQFEVNDIWVGLEPALWTYHDGSYWFADEVNVNTRGRDPKPRREKLTVKAPC